MSLRAKRSNPCFGRARRFASVGRSAARCRSASSRRWFRQALRYAQGRSTIVVAVACFATAPCPHAASSQAGLVVENSVKSRDSVIFDGRKWRSLIPQSPKVPSRIVVSIFLTEYFPASIHFQRQIFNFFIHFFSHIPSKIKVPPILTELYNKCLKLFRVFFRQKSISSDFDGIYTFSGALKLTLPSSSVRCP